MSSNGKGPNVRIMEFIVANDEEDGLLYITWSEGYVQAISPSLEEGIDSVINEIQAAHLVLEAQITSGAKLNSEASDLWSKINGLPIVKTISSHN